MIDPAPPGLPRPRWSVMIPSYDCAQYLARTLDSVLSQDPGPDAMQIEVVDDGSSDRPEDLVARLGGGRVAFFRQRQNVGPTRNFNTCIERSRGELVHILHGDDFVEAGFYDKMRVLADDNTDTALFSCRVKVVDLGEELLWIHAMVESFGKTSRIAKPLYYANRFLTPGVVVRRTFYETCGGFDTSLCHTADWEMWVRAITQGGCIMTEEPIAYYRCFDQSHTSSLERTADNLVDWLRLKRILRDRYGDFDPINFDRSVNRKAREQAVRYEKRGDRAAARANWKIWKKTVHLSDLHGPGDLIRWIRP